MVLKFQKKCIFEILCSLNEKPKSVKVICVYASEGSHYTLSENDMVNRSLSHHFWDISDQNIKKDANCTGI